MRIPIKFQCLCCHGDYYRKPEKGEIPDGWFTPNFSHTGLRLPHAKAQGVKDGKAD